MPFVLLAVVTVATAPVLGLVRDALLRRFPGSALKMLAAAMALLLLAVVIWVVREVLRSAADDGRRWFFLGVAAVALVAQLLGFRSGSIQVDVVEKMHVFQYGGLAFLAALALRRSELDESEDAGDWGGEHFWIPVFLAAIVGTLDETVQGFFQLRTGDIRDVALNALAAVTGACFASAVLPWRGLRRSVAAGQRRRVSRLAVIAVLWVSGFFYEAHLGYVIRDPEIGSFKSWFTAEELGRLAEEKTLAWRDDPPTGLRAWARQDYFLTEAAWHANHRNERLSSEDWTSAHQANRILEKYYDPFLDLESFRGSGKHRWGKTLSSDVASKALVLRAEDYFSPVLRQRIYPWPKPVFISIVTAMAVAILWLGRERS